MDVLGATFLSFSGGGVKGGAFCGALVCLDQIIQRLKGKKLTEQIEGCSGTSIGSIVAFMLTSGYQPLQMCQLFKTMHVETNEEFVRLWKEKSYVQPSSFYRVLDDIIENQGLFDKDITFRQHHQKTKKKLVIVASCLEYYNPVYFSHENHPEMKIKHALTASCAIPGILPHLRHKNQTYIDGAFTDNFPLVFPMQKTLGFRFSFPQDVKINDFKDIMIHSMFCTMLNLEKVQFNAIPARTRRRIITCNSNAFSLQFHASNHLEILKSGKQSIVHHFLATIVVPEIFRFILRKERANCKNLVVK